MYFISLKNFIISSCILCIMLSAQSQRRVSYREILQLAQQKSRIGEEARLLEKSAAADLLKTISLQSAEISGLTSSKNLMISQMFPAPFSGISQIAAAASDKKASAYNVQSASAEIYYEVSRLIAALFALEDEEQIAMQEGAILDKLKSELMLQKAEGKLVKAEILKTEGLILKNQSRLIAVTSGQIKVKAELNLHAGRPVQNELSIERLPQIADFPDFSICREISFSNRSDLLMHQQMKTAAMRRLTAHRLSILPGWQAAIGADGKAEISLVVPLAGFNLGAVKSAKIDYLLEDLKLKNMNEKNELEIFTAWNDFQQAKKISDKFIFLKNNAEDLLQELERQRREGRWDAYKHVEAVDEVIEVFGQKIASDLNAEFARIELEHVMQYSVVLKEKIK